MIGTLLSCWPFGERSAITVHDDDDSRNDRALSSCAADGVTAQRFQSFTELDDETNHEQWIELVKFLLGDSYRDFENVDLVDLCREQIIPTATLIRRVEQLESWDCGMACLLMAMDWARHEHQQQAPCSRQDLLQEIATQSVWTVDLVWLLHKHIDQRGLGLRFLFSSWELQVNTSLLQFDYYKAAFRSDRERVNAIFDRLRQQELPVIQQRNLSLKRIIQLIRLPNCIAIALVDNSILLERFGKPKQYTGHYIMLLGISRDISGLDTDHDICLVTENPGKKASYYSDSYRISLELFERAWRAPGTDEDIVFLVKTESSEL